MVTSFFAFADTKGTPPDGQNFPHIKTFGFNYVRFQDNNANLDSLIWAATHHDWIVGTKGRWPAAGVDYLDALTYNTIKDTNPDAKIMSYLPYHSISPTTMTWLENWATNNAYNPEDIYYHYDIDTQIRILNSELRSIGGNPSVPIVGVVNIEQSNPAIVELIQRHDLPAGAKLIMTSLDASTHPIDGATYTVLPIQGQRYRYYLYTDDATPQAVDGTGFPVFTGDWTYTTADNGYITVPGFPNGWAPTKFDSRLRVRWNHGWLGINPSSQVFREAYQALSLHVITLEGTTNVFAEGLFLDTFEGIIDNAHWTSSLENTVELGNVGDTEAVYAQARADLVSSKNALDAFLKQATGNTTFRLHPNSADANYIYNNYSSLYNEEYRSDFMDLSIEFLVTTTTNSSRISRLQDIYDDIESGREFFIRSQTNFGTATEIPFGFQQLILATHYLVNHENVHFMYHYGNAGNYGGSPYGNLQPTHWHPNMEVNIGQPVARSAVDYWGATNTNRFFIFVQGADYTILAREYTNALVLSKFAQTGGWANIGNNSTVHQLDNTYYRLNANNTTGEGVTSVTLGNSEGMILMKAEISFTDLIFANGFE